MTLAMRFDQLIQDGVVEDQGEIARLLCDACTTLTDHGAVDVGSDIQEAILMLPGVHEGRDTVTERHLRRITRSLDWSVQRDLWGEVV